MFKRLFLFVSRTLFKYIDLPEKLRNTIMWPIGSRFFGKNFSETIILKNGIAMKTDLQDQLGRAVIFYGPTTDYFWEPQTTKLMELLLKDSSSALVAGSHIGYMALMARRAMQREDAVVYTFEPIPYLHTVSEANIELNKSIGRIEISKSALSDRDGEAEMTIDSLKSSIVDNDKGGQKVNTVTVDSFYSESHKNFPSFMLLDVEGFEERVLLGAKNVLSSVDLQDVIFEISPKISGSLEGYTGIQKILEPLGFSCYFVEDDYSLLTLTKTQEHKPKIAKIAGIDNYSEYRYFNVLATRRSVNDLINLGIEIS